MILKVKGKYQFRQGNKILLTGENIITLLGESFFMNRWCNDHFQPIEYICLGTGTAYAQKKDIKLGNETIRKKCKTNVDLRNKLIQLTCEFTASEIKNTSEIGVANDKILISHDVYKTIDSSFLNNAEGTYDNIIVDYKFILTTGSIRSWVLSKTEAEPTTEDLAKAIYYTYEPNFVVGVFEKASSNEYKKVSSKDELEAGSYYYDNIGQNLYIVHSKLKNPNNNNDIIVKTKG